MTFLTGYMLSCEIWFLCVLAVHVAAKECLKNTEGLAYKGTVSTTRTGINCRRWSGITVNNEVQTAQHNYCRNPDADPKGPWCFTSDPDVFWEHCSIPLCDDVDITTKLGFWKCHHYTEIELGDIKTYGEVQVCERNGRVHTYGNNINFTGCGRCHCCSENELTTSVSTNIELNKTTTLYTTDSGTKTTFAEFLTSTSKRQNASQSLCRCQCSSQLIDQSTGSHNYTTAQLKQLMQEELREMSEQLKIQKNLTSAWIRARRSADDRRMTSVGMGYVAIVIIVMPFVLVVVSDCRVLIIMISIACICVTSHDISRLMEVERHCEKNAVNYM